MRTDGRMLKTAGGLVAVTVVLGAGAVTAAGAPKPPDKPPPPTHLVVHRTGYHGGTVTDDKGKLTCPDVCSGSYERACVPEHYDAEGECTLAAAPQRPKLTTTVPSGFVASWEGRACDEGTNTGVDCTVEADNGDITVHYDDATAPELTLTSPAAGPRHGSLTLSATATDTQSTVAGVEFFVGGDSVATDTTAPYSVSFSTASRPDGPVTVRAHAVNGDGDASDASVGITIDNKLPALTVSGPDGQTFGAAAKQTWSYTASDATSGPAVVQCSVTPAGSAPSFAACLPGAGSHSVSGRPGGSYSARFRATDGAGNVTEVVRAFTVDATPPITRIDSGPADGTSSTATSVTFGFSAAEAGSTFKCRVHPAALTPGAFGPCSGAGTHTASGFALGTYTFEVVATDAAGNTDPTPPARTFTVSGPTGGPSTGTTPGTTSGTTTGVVTSGRIDGFVQTLFTRFGRRTRVSKLTVVGAPTGATVTVACKGRRKACPFKRLVLPFKGSRLTLADRFKHRKLRAGTVITVTLAKPGLVAKSLRYTLRPTRFPAVHISVSRGSIAPAPEREDVGDGARAGVRWVSRSTFGPSGGGAGG